MTLHATVFSADRLPLTALLRPQQSQKPQQLAFGAATSSTLPPSTPAKRTGLWGWVKILSTLFFVAGAAGLYSGATARQTGMEWQVDTDHWTAKTEVLPPLEPVQAREQFLKADTIQWHFVQPVNGQMTEVPFSANSEPYRQKIADDIVNSLVDRPDLFRQILATPYTISLLDTPVFYSKGAYAVGYTDEKGVMMATPAVMDWKPVPEYPQNTVVHEILGHGSDYRTPSGAIRPIECDGLLPGWTTAEIKTFKTLREKELVKIARGISAIQQPHAQDNDEEFLAYTVETYLSTPQALKATSPELFTVMDTFFHHQADKVFTDKPTIQFYLFHGGYGVMLLSLATGLYAGVIRSKKTPQPEAS